MVNNNAPTITITLTILGKRTDDLLLDLAIRSNSTEMGTQLLGGMETPEPLPPIPQSLLDSLTTWEKSYLHWGKPRGFRSRAISLPTNPQMNVSDAETQQCQNLDALQKQIVAQFNSWLDEREISRTTQSIIGFFSHQQYIHHPQNLSLILQARTTDPELNLRLQKLPWSEWSFINREYPGAGIALSGKAAKANVNNRRRPKTLVICGNYQNPASSLNTDTDRLSIEHYLRGRGMQNILDCGQMENSRQALFEHLEQYSYDMIFFCGHSSEDNQIQLNDNVSISINDGRFRSLLIAQRLKGLKLVFLNSCHSLSAANIVESAGVPFVIAMKSAVSDENAQKFIQEFMRQFTDFNKPLHVAVETARSVLNEKSPNGGLLPVLLQNPEQPRYYASKKSFNKLVIAGSCLAIIGAILAVNQIKTSDGLTHRTPICKFATQSESREQISCGAKTFSDTQKNPEINQALRAFADKNYKLAVEILGKPENKKIIYTIPELWVYYNNALVLLQDEKNIKSVAVTVPYTDEKVKRVAEETLRGVAFAQEEWNNEHRNWKILVVVVDDKNQAEGNTKEVITHLSNNVDILAVIGHYSSTLMKSLKEIYNKNKMTNISYSSTADSLNQDNPYFFRVATGDESTSVDMIKYWAKSPQIKNLIIFNSAKSGGEHSKSMTNALSTLAKNNGKNIEKTFELNKVEEKKGEIEEAVPMADGIIILSDANTVFNELNGVKEIISKYGGYKPILGNRFMSGPGVLCGESPIIPLRDSKKLSTFTAISSVAEDDRRYVSTPYGQRIIREMKARAAQQKPEQQEKNRISDKMINSYDAMQVFIAAAKNARTKEEFYQAISKKDFSATGITGAIGFEGSKRKQKMTSFLQPQLVGNECQFKTVDPARLNLGARW